MEHIQEIIENRSTDQYYTDCVKGAQLDRVYRVVKESVILELEEKSREEIEFILRNLLDKNFNKEVEGVDLNIANEIIAGMKATKKVDALAVKFGCKEYEYCLFCPKGRLLVAEEIWQYAMCGKRSG